MGKAQRVIELAEALSEYEVVDVHHHLGSWGAFGGQGGTGAPDDELDFDARFRYMDGYGIDFAVIHPSQNMASHPEFISARNDEVMPAIEKAAGRFIAGIASLPLGSVDDLTSEWDRVRDRGFAAVGFHHRFNGRPLNTPMMDTVCELAVSASMPVLVHCVAESGLCQLWRLSSLARRWPNVTFVALVAFSSASQGQQCLEVALERPNVYFETSLMSPVPCVVGEFCKVAGSNRLLFGTDLYTNPSPIAYCPTPLFEILATPIPKADLARILGGNARELLSH